MGACSSKTTSNNSRRKNNPLQPTSTEESAQSNSTATKKGDSSIIEMRRLNEVSNEQFLEAVVKGDLKAVKMAIEKDPERFGKKVYTIQGYT